MKFVPSARPAGRIAVGADRNEPTTGGYGGSPWAGEETSMKTLRATLITDGLIAPARPGDPTPATWLSTPATLRIDAKGAAEAAKVIANPPSEERALKDLRNGFARAMRFDRSEPWAPAALAIAAVAA